MKRLAIWSVMACAGAALSAQQPAQPEMLRVKPDNGYMMGMADNGLWVTGYATADNGEYICPQIYDVRSGKFIKLFGEDEEFVSGIAGDVTNDGRLVVGRWKGLPSIYNRDSGKWQHLPVKEGENGYTGTARRITPDGKYAIGDAYRALGGGDYIEIPYLWDLTSGTPVLVDLPGMPDVDPEGNPVKMVRLLEITPDGKKILGYVNYMDPMRGYGFVYDVDTKKWFAPGYVYDGKTLQPEEGPVLDIEEGLFSPNGKYLCVLGYTQQPNADMAIYDLSTGEVQLVPQSSGKLLCGIDNNGVVYASAPTSPARDWGFYANGYWFDWKSALKQVYNIDWQYDFVKDEWGLSGTLIGATGDGLTVVASDFSERPAPFYIINLPESLDVVSSKIDLLANYNITPAAGESFSSLREVTVLFDRPVEVVDGNHTAMLKDAAGNVVKNSLSIGRTTGQTNSVSIVFRNTTLAKGETYTLVIPAGTVQIEGDAARTNREIRVNYVGRADEPVKPVKISPEPGTSIPRLNMSTNPVRIEFDATLTSLDNGGIGLYSITDGVEEYLYSLSGSITGNVLSVYPVSEQELAKGVNYKIVVEPGTVGDIVGSNANERIEIVYEGSYEPKAEYDDGIIYEENFDAGLSKMMLYDGDKLSPQSVPSSWGFTNEYPWWYVRDSNESVDQSAASHSMYSPIGKSDDWMVTRRMYIPDDACSLSFDSQSFRKQKQDRLKVYVYATDEIFTAPITKNAIDKFKAEAELVYDKLQSPGESEELLAGEWTHNVVPLAKYAGKNIYIAFVNDNEDQSAVFIDNVKVQQEQLFALGVQAPAYVVDESSVEVKGVIVIKDDSTPFDSASFSLYDGSGNLIDALNPGNLSLSKDDTYEFAFGKPLPLTKGCENAYRVVASIGDASVVYDGVIFNLYFKPDRKIVLEEGTGTQCPYCPLGLRAMELIDDIYGDKVIPVVIHSYSGGSAFRNEWANSYGSFLGYPSYPQGVLNREWMGSPFYSTPDNTFLMNGPDNAPTWFDTINKMLAEVTEAEITIDHAYIDKNSGLIEVGAGMRYAYDNENANLNIHTVVLENGLVSRQANAIYTNTSEILGEWAGSGAYATDNPVVEFDHIARGMHGDLFVGMPGLLPKSVTGGKQYDATYSFAIPKYVSDQSKTDVVVMLIDANTGRIVNAAKAPLVAAAVGVDDIADDNARVQRGDVYNMQGIRVMRDALRTDINRLGRGIYIFNGQKVIVR